MRGDHQQLETPKHQADATLTQAAPVNGTWYTILDTTKNALIYAIVAEVATTGETLEVKVTIDGQTYTGSVAHAADTAQFWFLNMEGAMNSNTSPYMAGIYAPLMGRSVKVEIRKTTAAGAGNLIGRVTHGKW